MPDRYVRFGKAYHRFRELQTQVACGASIHDVPEDALLQMLFMATLVHEHAGTNPNFERYHREAIREALADKDAPFEHRVLYDKDFPDQVWRAFACRCPNGKTNEKHTYGLVAGSLRLLQQRGSPHWIGLLKGLSPEEARSTLDDLRGIGPKLSSFVLREFQAFFKIWPEVVREQWYCFFPVDRWVLRVVKLVWPSPEWPVDPPTEAIPYRRTAEAIVERLDTVEEGMEFNMGAWFLNAMRGQILALHGAILISDLTDEALHEVAVRLDEEKVAAALTTEVTASAISQRHNERLSAERKTSEKDLGAMGSKGQSVNSE